MQKMLSRRFFILRNVHTPSNFSVSWSHYLNFCFNISNVRLLLCFSLWKHTNIIQLSPVTMNIRCYSFSCETLFWQYSIVLKGPILWKVRFSFFLIIKQASVLHKYCESMKTLNRQRNAQRSFSALLNLLGAAIALILLLFAYCNKSWWSLISLLAEIILISMQGQSHLW